MEAPPANAVEEQKWHRCNACSKTYTLAKNLYRHQRTKHIEQDRFNCDICPSSFERSDYLLKHKRSQHPEVFCPTCENPLIDVVTISCLYECRKCFKCFKRQDQLTRHPMDCPFSRGGSYACSYCGTTFAQKVDRDRHQRECGKRQAMIDDVIYGHGLTAPVPARDGGPGQRHISSLPWMKRPAVFEMDQRPW